MIRWIRRRQNDRKKRDMVNKIRMLVKYSYPLPADLALSILTFCGGHMKTDVLIAFEALDQLMAEGKVVKGNGDGLLPDRFYELSPVKREILRKRRWRKLGLI